MNIIYLTEKNHEFTTKRPGTTVVPIACILALGRVQILYCGLNGWQFQLDNRIRMFGEFAQNCKVG